jgi:hypothetical protein
VYLVLAVWRLQPEMKKRYVWGLLAMVGGVFVLAIAARHQAGAGEGQLFFSRLTPLQEKLQRMRAAYVWVSMWGPDLAVHYTVACAILAAAGLRIRRRLPFELQVFLFGLPLIGLLSMPLSYLLLERMRWALIPQFQPMRALLFVVLMMQFSAGVAGAVAGIERRFGESFAWFALAYLAPLATRFDQLLPANRLLTLVLLAGIAAAGFGLEGARRQVALSLAAVAAFWIVPEMGRVTNYPRLHTSELAGLSRWARTETRPDAVFLFADTPRSLDPGIFRAEALRAVYVDWKGGGQVNYLKELGEQWWFRWQQTLGAGFHPADIARYDALGIQYVVLQPQNRLLDRAPVFQNSKYLAYRCGDGSRARADAEKTVVPSRQAVRWL